MTLNDFALRAAAVLTLGCLAVAPVYAQTTNFDLTQTRPSETSINANLDYRPQAYGLQALKLDSPRASLAAGSGISMNTLMLVSAIVLIVGVIDDDRTLEVLGGVGVIIALLESNQKLGLQPVRPGLLHVGPVSLGIRSDRTMTARPTPYAQVTFKF